MLKHFSMVIWLEILSTRVYKEVSNGQTEKPLMKYYAN